MMAMAGMVGASTLRPVTDMPRIEEKAASRPSAVTNDRRPVGNTTKAGHQGYAIGSPGLGAMCC